MNKRLLLAGSIRMFTRYSLRSFFMGLGIVIGVAALVVMRSMGQGAEKNMLDKLENLFSAGSIVIVNSGHMQRGGVLARGKLTIDDLEAIAADLDQVIDWNPTVTLSEQEVECRGRGRMLKVIGGSERGQFVSRRGVEEGEYFTRADVRSSARVALLGRKAADSLFDGEDPVGKEILIAGAPYRVKGVLQRYGLDPHGMDRDDEIHVPISTAMRRLANLDTIGSAKLILSSVEVVDETVEEIADILVERHGLADDEPDDFSIYTPTQVQDLVRKANRTLSVYLPATAGIALAVAAAVIANLMLLGVRERIPEIGLRKAVGATDSQISGQFLLESLAVTILSGVVGVVLGAGVLIALSVWGNANAAITLDAVFLGLASALVVGVLAGFLPARRAARLEPVDALR